MPIAQFRPEQGPEIHIHIRVKRFSLKRIGGFERLMQLIDDFRVCCKKHPPEFDPLKNNWIPLIKGDSVFVSAPSLVTRIREHVKSLPN